MAPDEPTLPAPIVSLRSAERTPLLFTTNMGLEDVVIEEFRERSAAAKVPVLDAEAKPFDRAGYALLGSGAPRDEALHLAHQMRSVHHLLEPHYSFPLLEKNTLDTLHDVIAGVDLPAMETAKSFRVTTVRNGDHDFTSIDVQRVAGAALEARYGTAVDLDAYTVEVRVDIHDRRCLVSIQHTREALSRRQAREYEPRAALQPNVAYGLLQLARLDPAPDTLLDPFCGSGTILLEAAHCWPETHLYGIDWNEETVEGARCNAAADGCADRITIRHADARHLADAFSNVPVQAIVTNPPFGVRLGEDMNFSSFYRRVLEQAAAVLMPGGRFVMLVLKQGAFNRALQQSDAYDVRHVRVIETGSLYPRLFVLERT